MNPIMYSRITSACWAILIAVWVIASFSVKPTVRKANPAARARYVTTVLGGMLLLALSTHFSRPWNIIIWRPDSAARFVGALFIVLGTVFALWARRTLGRNWSGVVTLKTDHQLIQTGPYALVRHPIYTGMLLMIVGTVVNIGTIGCVCGLFMIMLGVRFKLLEEEKLMSTAFGGKYAEYSARVPRLVPFIHYPHQPRGISTG